jgi:peptidoglycan/xylan/chitin deacetylase (PgdA/CDA1 family)
MFVAKSLTGEDFYRIVVDQFDQLYKEGETTGRVMALCLHPFIINQPFRQKYLERALDYIAGHDGVWLTTSDEIASHYAEKYMG